MSYLRHDLRHDLRQMPDILDAGDQAGRIGYMVPLGIEISTHTGINKAD